MDSHSFLTIKERQRSRLQEPDLASPLGPWATDGISAARMVRRLDSVLCFGDSDWWYHNRGHADMQFIRRFAKRCPVVYVNSLGVKAPRLSDKSQFGRRVWRKLRSVGKLVRDTGEGFAVATPVFWPGLNGRLGRLSISSLAGQMRLLLSVKSMHHPLIWVACPTAATVIDRLPHIGVVYQLSDCYASLGGESCNTAARLEAMLARRADVVLCASRQLLERARQRHGVGEYVDHGVDFDLFDRASRSGEVPLELLDAARPLIGFFGNVDGNTVDRDLLDEVVRRRPRYHFAFVGPMATDFRSLCRHANVTAIPRREYADVPSYGAAFDVCLMPWLQNEWIAHCNPVKLKEYLALGKPVVSTPFPELQRSGAPCYQASGPHEFAAAIDRALAEDDIVKREQRKAWASAHTWDSQFGIVLELLAERGIHADGDVA